ncbi:S-adenosyl-L-methionine-dependent methyltransferase [Periconia macrospinosa]|uniref:S-adenosyl-L-methionine-dependent methyltransferase n=1 Tax=Periconia macrospinosa TaxID=97972 RepID=A0A2V1DUQ5_9PLEO|nr:S-adenosyl-L-methionine-dependent methyltransferase [Periconia macrospinosa]
MSSLSRVHHLSETIARDTGVVERYLKSNDLPTPTLDATSLWSIPIADDAVDVKQARLSVIEACSELQALMTGPKELLHFSYTAYVSVKAVLRFKLDKSFPVGSETNFQQMSEFSGLNVMNVKRIVRHAIMNHRFFQEETPGIITHSALTAVLAQDELARNALIVELDEFWPAGVKAADALEKWPNSEECNQTGFSLANNSDKGMYDILAANPDRGERFGMYFSQADEPSHLLLENFPWADQKTVVDVGGSHGSVAITIAENFPQVACIVQDLPDTAAEGSARLPKHLQDRVSFMAHDFFTEQPVAADVYYFRSIFHNWADKYCIKILQNLTPALKPGAKIVIHERILPSLDTLSTADARRAINMDIGVLQLLNAQQREMHEWPELFRRADARYQFLGAKKPDGAIRWIIEAEWRG